MKLLQTFTCTYFSFFRVKQHAIIQVTSLEDEGESIIKFKKIENRFHVTLRILSPEIFFKNRTTQSFIHSIKRSDV